MGELRPLLSPGKTALTRLLTRMCSETAEQDTHPTIARHAPILYKDAASYDTQSHNDDDTGGDDPIGRDRGRGARARHVARR
jgi:hypothetical protein